jgi:hypothetical protein
MCCLPSFLHPPAPPPPLTSLGSIDRSNLLLKNFSIFTLTDTEVRSYSLLLGFEEVGQLKLSALSALCLRPQGHTSNGCTKERRGRSDGGDIVPAYAHLGIRARL